MKDTLTLERELLTTRALLARQEANVTALLAHINELKAERDALKEEVERCEATIRFWKKGACDLLQELEER